jgi:hypothetical protein
MLSVSRGLPAIVTGHLFSPAGNYITVSTAVKTF